MIYTALDNFYLTDEELANSPSRKHDIDEETETTLRIFGCELIQEAGILLKCPQAVMATGQVLFQRFFCRKSMREFNVRRMACACLFLATKLEESHRRTRDFLMVFDRINKRRDGSKSLQLLIPETKEYDVMKERVITYERILLKTFGFVIHAVHPHKYVNSFVHSLEGSDELQQLAWNMLNDSLRTTLCVRFKGHVVAAGAIYLAARRLEVPLPENPPWWEAFKVPTDELVEVVLALHDLYQRPKAHYIEVNPDVLKQQAAVSGMGAIKQLTPGPEGNDSPAAQDSSIIRGGPDPSAQVGPPVAAGPVATTTTAPPATGTGNAAADMLAATIAAAQQRLQGSVLAAGMAGGGVATAATAGAAAAATTGAAPQQRPDPDVVSTVQQVNGPTLTGDAGQANGGGATSTLDGGAAQSRKRSRSRSQDRGRRRSRSTSRSRSRERSRSNDRDRERSRRSRSRERDRQRESHRRDGSRRDRRSRSRSRDRRDRDRDRRDRDRDKERDKERGDRDRRERDGKGDRGRERERERERERGTERLSDREARNGAAYKDDGRDRKDDGLPLPPPLPPRHPDRSHRR